MKCAEYHKTSDCTSETIKCVNCAYSNNKYSNKLEINHTAYDANLCSILKKKITKFIESTDYPLSPSLPSHDTVYNSRKSTRQQIPTADNKEFQVEPVEPSLIQPPGKQNTPQPRPQKTDKAQNTRAITRNQAANQKQKQQLELYTTPPAYNKEKKNKDR